MKKKLILCVLLASCVLALAACNGNTSNGQENVSANSTAQQIPVNKTSSSKLTYDDIKQIIAEVTENKELSLEEQKREIRNRACQIQSEPDHLKALNTGINWYYWPDSDTESDRRECIVFIRDGKKIKYMMYDDDDAIIHEELLFSSSDETKHSSNPSNEVRPKDNLLKSEKARLEELDKLAEQEGMGEFVYQKKLIQTTLQPGMRKITPAEIKELAERIQGGDWNFRLIPEIAAIQPIPDAKTSHANPEFDCYYYWPDADTFEERRQELKVDIEYERITYTTYDDNGAVVSTEVLYDSGVSYD